MTKWEALPETRVKNEELVEQRRSVHVTGWGERGKKEGGFEGDGGIWRSV